VLAHTTMPGFIQIILGTFGCVGMGALMLVGGLLMAAGSEKKRKSVLGGTRQVSCADAARGGTLGRHTVTYGQLSPGPSGLVTAPLSGRQVVWYETRVIRSYDRHHAGRPDEQGIEVVWRQGGGEPFALADQTGGVLVSGELLTAPNSHHNPLSGYFVGDEPVEVTVDESSGPIKGRGPHLQALIDRYGLDLNYGFRSGATGYRVAEFIVPAGGRATVFGVARAQDGHIVLGKPDGPDDPYTVSVREPDQLMAKWTRDRRGSRKATWILLLIGVIGVGTAVLLGLAYR
jgi:hypothetical protein